MAPDPTPGPSRPRPAARPRGRTDRRELYDVLDSALVCHLGLVLDGAPVVLPTGSGRDGDTLYLHGSSGAASRLAAAAGAPVGVTVTRLDGIVYASAVVHGTASAVSGDDDVEAGAAWAGVSPVHTTWGVPQACPQLPTGLDVPSHVTNCRPRCP